MPERIVVVAAVIERGGRFLVTRRIEGTHLAGYWEFPGGKVHEGETQEAALQREILEELNAGVLHLRKIFHTAHAYPERTIELHFFRGELTLRSAADARPGATLDSARRVQHDEFSAGRRGANRRPDTREPVSR